MVTLSPAIRPVRVLPYLLSIELLFCHLLFVEWLSPAFAECLYCHTCYLFSGYIVLKMFSLSPAIRRMPFLYLLSVKTVISS